MTTATRITVDDIVEIEEFVTARWPNRTPWTQATRSAWLTELARWDYPDVWEALNASTGVHPPQVMELVDRLRARKRVDQPTPHRQLGRRTVAMADWLKAHNWAGLADALHNPHPDDCTTCADLGVPTRPQPRTTLIPVCHDGRKHAWSSVDRLDLQDTGTLTQWCSVCHAERHTRPGAGR